VGHCTCSKTHPHVSNRGDNLHIRRRATNVFKKMSGQPTMGAPLPRKNLFYCLAYR
jgi:hypothetical protein